MNSIELLANIYKPYKISYKGSTKIFKCTSGNYVIKNKKDKDIKELYSYLNSRNFTYYPKLIEDNRSDINVFEYIEDYSIDDEQKLNDLLNLVSLLHNKTSYYKEITNDKIKSIYEELLGRVEYIEDYFNKLIFDVEDNVFISPSSNILLINSTKVFDSLTFIKKEIDKWYQISIDKNKMRVCLLHNNLELDHYLKNKNDYLISWESSKIDTPIIDIVKLYKKVFLTLDFIDPLKTYLEKFPLNDSEMELLYIMLALPDELILTNDELKNVKNTRIFLDYIYKTENLIKNIYKKD